MFSYMYAPQPYSADLFTPVTTCRPYIHVHYDPYAQARREREVAQRRRRELLRQLAMQEQAEHDARAVMQAIEAHRQRAAYQMAMRAERNRRVSAALAAQRAQDDEDVVQVQFADGRRYMVPASWISEASKSSHTKEATSKAVPEQTTAASPEASSSVSKAPVVTPIADKAATTVQPLVLETTKKLNAVEEPIRIVVRSPSPTPKEALECEQRDHAARTLQKMFRRRQALKRLDSIRSQLETLRRSFVEPTTSQLVFSSSPDTDGETSPPLAFNKASNRPVQEYEQALLNILTSLDEVNSAGCEQVRQVRKALVHDAERELEKIDELRSCAWASQRSSSPSIASDDEVHEESHVEEAKVGDNTEQDVTSPCGHTEIEMVTEEQQPSLDDNHAETSMLKSQQSISEELAVGATEPEPSVPQEAMEVEEAVPSLTPNPSSADEVIPNNPVVVDATSTEASGPLHLESPVQQHAEDEEESWNGINGDNTVEEEELETADESGLTPMVVDTASVDEPSEWQIVEEDPHDASATPQLLPMDLPIVQ